MGYVVWTQLVTMSEQCSPLSRDQDIMKSEEQVVKEPALNFFRRNISIAGKGNVYISILSIIQICYRHFHLT